MPKVLVACEESQAVTNELRKLNIDAYSCDIEPTSGDHPEWHLQQDVTPLLQLPWDMILAFPPCTHLAVTGARFFAQKQADGRQQAAIDFFMQFANADCPRICIENPVSIMSTRFRKPDQIIQPWMFGHEVTKTTCLWLKGLPKLEPTCIVDTGTNKVHASGRQMSDWYYQTSLLPHKDRSKARSKTWPGIAKAMAQQWGNLLLSENPRACSS